eukprot:1681652-Amphidinium_carterae.1
MWGWWPAFPESLSLRFASRTGFRRDGMYSDNHSSVASKTLFRDDVAPLRPRNVPPPPVGQYSTLTKC